MDDKNETNILNITTFNFYQDPMRSSKAWVSLFMFNVSADPSILVDMMYLLNMNVNDISTLMYSSKSKVLAFF